MKKKNLITNETEEKQEVEMPQNIEEEKVEKPSKSENFFKGDFNND